MEFTRRLRRLWRHPQFRRLTLVRLFGQSGDGTTQVGMASYLLFSPQSQTSAWAVAGVLALTMLPYSLLGPFVAILLDRYPRQRVSLTVDVIRTICSLLLAAMISQHLTSGAAQPVLVAALLIMLSLNRFNLAGLQAGLACTVDDDEYLDASAIMPMIGPAATLIGGGIAGLVRIIGGQVLTIDTVNGIIFAQASLLFICSILFCLRIPAYGLGPTQGEHRSTLREVIHGLFTGLHHLGQRPAAWNALITEAIVRIGYGFLMAQVVVLFRHHFFAADQLNSALAWIGVWFGVSGVGFVLSGVISVPIANRMGVRRTIIMLLTVMAASQASFGSIYLVGLLVINGFVIGLAGQSVKVQVDTVVQAHIDDTYRGRVFTLYDVIYNVSTVLGAVIAAWLLPVDAVSPVITIGLGALYLVTAVYFTVATRPLGNRLFDLGTKANPRS